MTKPIKDQVKQEIRAYTEDHTWKETSEKFNVSEMTIGRILKGNPISQTPNNNVVEGYKQFNSLFQCIMNNPQNLIKKSKLEAFREMVINNIDIDLIENINKEMTIE